MPIDAVAQLATAALQLFNYSGLPFTYDEIKYTIDAYIDKENLTVPVQLSELFPGLSPLSLPPPVLGITPPPPVTAAGDVDGEMTVSEVSDQDEEEELKIRPTRRSLEGEFKAARSR
jgi:hypothetical protein